MSEGEVIPIFAGLPGVRARLPGGPWLVIVVESDKIADLDPEQLRKLERFIADPPAHVRGVVEWRIETRLFEGVREFWFKLDGRRLLERQDELAKAELPA